MSKKIDIIILSYAKTPDLHKITVQCIDSLLASEDPEIIDFNILVIESNKALQPYQFEHTTTIYPADKFGFNKYLNMGIKQTHNPYICLCNNDLIFHKNWASEILKAMSNDTSLLNAAPYCPIFHKNAGFQENAPPVEGYFGVLAGWCIFAKREIFDIIGPLDEKLIFWYCDADYCQLLIKHRIKNCLISSSIVTHLSSTSLETLNKKENQKLTQIPRFYYSYKWHHHSYIKFKIQTALFKLKNFVRL